MAFGVLAEKQGSSLTKSYKKVEETQSKTTFGPSKNKVSQLAQDRFSPPKVKKWPEPQEIKQVAGEGILTCLQDAIDCLAQKQVVATAIMSAELRLCWLSSVEVIHISYLNDVQQITEQWSFIPRVVKELAIFDGSNHGSLTKEDLLREAKVCKQIYEDELSRINSGSLKRKRPKTDGGEEGNKGETKVIFASGYDSDETIKMTEEEIELAYKNFNFGTL
ncbi:hypothetical protein GOBAR_DD00417 [Gossypium barbadense]|nr:hypothetical protein GOBAR_DD00417 [Gossypium barbadense]